MKGFLKKAFRIPLKTKKSIDLDFKIAMWSLPVFVVGQIIQNPDYVDIQQIPRFLRHHLTNFVDVPIFAAMLNATQSAITKKSRPITSASIILALGTLAEISDSKMPNRTFDWTDQSLFLATTLSYCLIHNRHQKQDNITPKPLFGRPC